MTSYYNSTIAYLNVITEIVDIIIKHLFLTVITPHSIGQPRSQGSLLPVPTERVRERPWLGLVTWSQNKINSEGGVLCFSFFFCLVRFHRSRNDRKGKTDFLSLQL